MRQIAAESRSQSGVGKLRSLAASATFCTLMLTASTVVAQSTTPFGTPLGLENPGVALNGQTGPGTRPMGWQQQGRSEVVARNGMVATSHHLAAHAGLEILEKGGERHRCSGCRHGCSGRHLAERYGYRW